jgi:protein arginine kinase
MYQISNQKTLGFSEEEIVNNVINISEQIIEQESYLRKDIYNKNKYRFEDKVMRAYGILKNARIISSDESLKMLSDVRWGCDVGVIENIPKDKLDFLITAIQPGCIQKMSDNQIEPEERDTQRAAIIRDILEK